MPLAPSFDAAGWFARDAATRRRVGSVLLGGPLDSKGGDATRWRRLLLPEDAFALAVPAAQQALAPLVERTGQRLAPTEALQAGGTDSLADWMWRFRPATAGEIMGTQGPWIAKQQPPPGPEVQSGFDWTTPLTP